MLNDAYVLPDHQFIMSASCNDAIGNKKKNETNEGNLVEALMDLLVIPGCRAAAWVEW